MQPPTNAIHRSLFFRVAGITLLLAVLAGSSSYLHERGLVSQAISEQAAWGTELLKAQVEIKLSGKDGPWQSAVQAALEDLSRRAPLTSSGRFVVVVVNDPAGREVGRLIRNPAEGHTDELPPLPDVAPGPSVRLGSVSQRGQRPLVPVVISVPGTDGSVSAIVRGVFEVSEEAIAKLQRRTAYVTLISIIGVLVTVLVIFPIVRRLTGRLTDLSSQLLDANLQSLRLLGSAIAKRDSDTDAHNYRVTVYAVRLAEQAGLDDAAIRLLIKGAFLHDVGKIGTPDRVLLKPGKLDDEEFAEMKRHVTHGLDIVSQAPWLREAAAVVGYHHEKYDGSGYDRGLDGERIPLAARIFAIADVFDALTSERPYKKPFSRERSLQIMREDAGSHFDPALLNEFERIAAPLYRIFANEDAAARQELDGIIDRYFSLELAAILRDVRPDRRLGARATNG